MDPPLKSTLVTMKLLAPSMFWSMIVISMIVERPWVTLRKEDNTDELLRVFGLGLIGGIFAVFMILCEFYLILRASAIILMIGGVIKELTTIMIGVSFFGDKLNLINTTGVGIVFSGVLLYKVVFHMEKKAGQEQSMEAVPTDEVDDELHFMDEDEINGKIAGDSAGFRDKNSDDESEDDYKETREKDGILLSNASVEMVEHGTNALHLRALRHSESDDNSRNGGEATNGIV